jgi:hypothetical protein
MPVAQALVRDEYGELKYPADMGSDDDLAKRLANAITELAETTKRLEQEKAVAVEWEKKAMLAIKAGNDELAKQALARKLAHEKLAVECEADQRSKTSYVEEVKKALANKSGTSSSLPVAIPTFMTADDSQKLVADHNDLQTKLRLLDRLDVEGELTALKEKMGILPTRKKWIH